MRTTRTGQCACLATESETLSIRARLILPRPLLPMTIRSAPSSSAKRTISLSAPPLRFGFEQSLGLPVELVLVYPGQGDHLHAGVGSIAREAGNRITQTSGRTEDPVINGMTRDVSEGMRTAFEGYRRSQYLDRRVRL